MSVAARLHALLWGVFSLGGFIAAFLLPVLIYVNNIAYPLGLWPVTSRDPTSLLVTDQIIGSLFVFVAIAGSFFHGVFRFTATLGELGLKNQVERIVSVGYALIAVGILALLYYLLALNPSFVNMVLHILGVR